MSGSGGVLGAPRTPRTDLHLMAVSREGVKTRRGLRVENFGSFRPGSQTARG